MEVPFRLCEEQCIRIRRSAYDAEGTTCSQQRSAVANSEVRERERGREGEGRGEERERGRGRGEEKGRRKVEQCIGIRRTYDAEGTTCSQQRSAVANSEVRERERGREGKRGGEERRGREEGRGEERERNRVAATMRFR